MSLMLILDVKTCWSSTHQMLCMSVSAFFWQSLLSSHIGCALDFAKEIDDIIGNHRDLRALELDTADWSAICLVAGWLKAFHSATTDMSNTKEPMFSTVHAIFHGLQDHIHLALADLPDSAPHQLTNGLIKAHKKLSNYYYHSDESPYYTWAACMLYIFPNFIFLLTVNFSLQYLIHGLCMKGSGETALQTAYFSQIWITHKINWRHSITRTMLIGLVDPPFEHRNRIHPFLQLVVVPLTLLKT